MTIIWGDRKDGKGVVRKASSKKQAPPKKESIIWGNKTKPAKKKAAKTAGPLTKLSLLVDAESIIWGNRLSGRGGLTNVTLMAKADSIIWGN